MGLRRGDAFLVFAVLYINCLTQLPASAPQMRLPWINHLRPLPDGKETVNICPRVQHRFGGSVMDKPAAKLTAAMVRRTAAPAGFGKAVRVDRTIVLSRAAAMTRLALQLPEDFRRMLATGAASFAFILTYIA
jgi:hypothetical protein